MPDWTRLLLRAFCRPLTPALKMAVHATPAVASRPPPSLKQFYQQTDHKTGKTARNFSPPPPPPPPPFLLLLHPSTAAVWSMLLRIHVKSIWIILASPQTSIQQPLLWRSSSRRKSRTLLFLKILKILFLFQPKHAQQKNLWMGVQVCLSSVQIWCIWEHLFGFDLQEENDVQGFSDQQLTD